MGGLRIVDSWKPLGVRLWAIAFLYERKLVVLIYYRLLCSQTRYKETQKLQKHRDTEATKAENRLSDDAVKKLTGMLLDINKHAFSLSHLV